MNSNKSLKVVWLVLITLVTLITVINLETAGDVSHAGHGGHDNVFESGALLPVKLSDIYAVELVYQGDLFLIEKDENDGKQNSF